MKKYVIGIIAMAIVFLAFYSTTARKLSEAKREIKDLRNELAHATLPILRNTMGDSIEVITQTVVTIDRPELKAALDQERQLVKELQLKVKQLEAVQTTAMVIHDTVQAVYVPPDSLFHYNDEWATLQLNMKDTTFYYNIRDSLSTFVFREYRHHFLWWKWGTKGYRLKIVNFNPHAHVYYNKYIKAGM